MFRRFGALVAAAILVTALPVSTFAGPIHSEVGDAGSTIAGAQLINDGTTADPVTSITGSIGGSGDADVYGIFISNPAAFSATTVGTAGSLGDTQLFLFNSAGLGVVTNDDAAAGGLRSDIPAANGFVTTPGLYYLAISTFNNDPLSASGFIFPNSFSGVNGPTGPGGGSPLTGFDGSSTGTGTYTINLTGAFHVTPAGPGPDPVPGVPEPTGMALFGFATVAAGYVAWRRRKRAVA